MILKSSYADNAIMMKAAKLSGHPSAGFRWSFNMDTNESSFDLYLFNGENGVSRWNPITNEKDLFNWIKDVGQDPFQHGFIAPITKDFSLPDDYVPKLGNFEDPAAYSRELLAALVGVLSSRFAQ